MNNSKVAETQLRYHHIGICVTVFDDKVTELLRKIVAHELSIRFDRLYQLQKLIGSNGETPESFRIVEDLYFILKCQDPRVTLHLNDYGDTFFEAARDMKDRYHLQWEFECPANPEDLANLAYKILQYLGSQPVVQQSLIKVLIERCIQSGKSSAIELNRLLFGLDDYSTPFRKPCVDDRGIVLAHFHPTCHFRRLCDFRWRRKERRIQQCDLVNEIRVIRNNIAHRYFKFKIDQGQDQEEEFLNMYKNFINRVDFQQIFPLNGEATKEEYLNIIAVHREAERRRLEQDKREEEEERKHLDYLDLAVSKKRLCQ